MTENKPEAASASPGEKRPVGRPRKAPIPEAVAAAAPAVPAVPVPGAAGASGNAAVQDLLAQREIAVLNGDSEAVAAADAALAGFGVAV